MPMCYGMAVKKKIKIKGIIQYNIKRLVNVPNITNLPQKRGRRSLVGVLLKLNLLLALVYF